MEKIRQIINFARSKKAQVAFIDQNLHLLIAGKSQAVGPTPAGWMDEVVKTIFPQHIEEVSHKEIALTEGPVSLIYEKNKKKISLYLLPEGEKLLQEALAILLPPLAPPVEEKKAPNTPQNPFDPSVSDLDKMFTTDFSSTNSNKSANSVADFEATAPADLNLVIPETITASETFSLPTAEITPTQDIFAQGLENIEPTIPAEKIDQSSDVTVMIAPAQLENFSNSEPNAFHNVQEKLIDLPISKNVLSTEKINEAEQKLTINYSANIPGVRSVSHGENPIDNILKTMVAQKASDLHLTGQQPIIMRKDGEIIRLDGELLTPEKMFSLLDPIIPASRHTEFYSQNDLDFAYELIGCGRFRVNIFRDMNGVGSVMRHIPDKVLTAQELNLPPAILKLCEFSKGLVLVTGPTGSGKSTTLAAMIDYINQTRKEHILTIEDPIEFVHQQKQCLINQREIGQHTQGFSRALKAALREDPDIVLVGELRDLETTSIAIETAETGHLVFGTLHTNTAISTIDRIIDQYPAEEQRIVRNMLASSLRGVVSQTLCRKKGGGRCAAHDILIMSDPVATMVREGKIHMIENHMVTQKAEGNLTFNESLINLVTNGKVDYKEAWHKAFDKKGFEELSKRRNIVK